MGKIIARAQEAAEEADKLGIKILPWRRNRKKEAQSL
jgi:hypothetical protein